MRLVYFMEYPPDLTYERTFMQSSLQAQQEIEALLLQTVES